MNKVLYKADFKSNWPILAFITGMLLMYTTIAVGMFDPTSAEALESMMKMLPEGMIKAFGFEGIGTELTGYLSSYLFGFIYLMFPVIFIVVVSNNLIAKHVDSGSMAYLLTTHHTRIKLASTQSIFLISSLGVMMMINLLTALIMSATMFPGQLDMFAYSILNFITFGCLYVISALSFFFSCFFNDSKKSLSFSAGIAIFFVVIKMVSGISQDLSFLKYLSIFSIINTDKILTDGAYNLVVLLTTLGLGSLIYLGAILVFDKRSLNI